MSHKPKDQLAKELKTAAAEVKVGGIYVHYKSPDSRYEVAGLAILEADDSVCVLYSPADDNNLTFVRPLTSWLDQVEWQGQTVPRFSLRERN